jgi:hypothetical protein
MRNFFEPATAAPSWLRQVLSSIRAALGDIWPAPLRLKDYATADLPAAADFAQGLVYDSTTQKPNVSTGSAWVPLTGYTDEDARDAIGAALVAGPAISIAVSDGSDTITVGDVIAATATGAPGTGSFTPTNAQKAMFAMTQLRVGGCYLFRFDDGAAWELRWGFYTGSVITRPANGFVASSSGSALTLGANAVASIMSPLGLWQRGMGETILSAVPLVSGATPTLSGLSLTSDGTAAAVSIADTNLFTRQIRNQYTSATTANAAGGAHGGNLLTTRNAGFHFCDRFGHSQLPTAPRLFVGLINQTSVMAVEPSTRLTFSAFAKDSTDTNIQFMTNDGSGTATKQDTSIANAINTLYEANIWTDPSGSTVFGLLVDYTNQALWYGSYASNLPAAGTGLAPQYCATLNGTDTGTAAIFHNAGLYVRSGA